MNIAAHAFPSEHAHAPTVLVVEDEILIRMALAAYLQECGFKVLEAGTADEAIQVLGVGALPVDLVFTDVAMPGERDGLALVAWVHQNHPEIAVAITSGDEARQKAVRDAINGHQFFPKPYDVGQVAARIRHLVDDAGHA